MRFYKHFVYFQFNKDLTINFAPPILMTIWSSNVIDRDFYNKYVYKVEIKTHKVSTSFVKIEGGHIDPCIGLYLPLWFIWTDYSWLFLILWIVFLLTIIMLDSYAIYLFIEFNDFRTWWNINLDEFRVSFLKLQFPSLVSNQTLCR